MIGCEPLGLELMGDRLESIEAGTQVFDLGNCMDILSLKEKMKTKKNMLENYEFSFDMPSFWHLQDLQVEMNSKLLDILTYAQERDIYEGRTDEVTVRGHVQ